MTLPRKVLSLSLSIKVIDKNEAKKVLSDDDIYNRISDDTSPKKESITFPDGVNYLGGYLGSKLISVFITHGSEYGMMAHFQVLKPYRIKHARELADKFLKIVPRPLYAEFPSLYKPYMNFVKKLGFKEIDMKENVYLKNGNYYDLYVLVLES